MTVRRTWWLTAATAVAGALLIALGHRINRTLED